jgi:hypothetical protein
MPNKYLSNPMRDGKLLLKRVPGYLRCASSRPGNDSTTNSLLETLWGQMDLYGTLRCDSAGRPSWRPVSEAPAFHRVQ